MKVRPRRPPVTSLAFQDDRELMTPGPVRDRVLDEVARMGGKWVRANVLYGRTNGGTDLRALDSLVDAARARGIRVQATLMADPRYLNPSGGLTYSNNDPALWSQFANNVATRMKGRVGRYSVGNEPNYPAFVKDADVNPRQAGRTYRQVYRSGRQAIKRVDPRAEVLFGEITNLPNTKEFLRYALGGKPMYTDGLAYHPYDQKRGTWDTRNLHELQATLKSYQRQKRLRTPKGAAAPLYLTEFGIQRGSMPDQQRARSVVAAYRRAEKAGARQFLQYQLTDKTNIAARGGYGAPGSPPAGAAWDTSIGSADGDLSVFARELRRHRRRRL